MRHWLMLVCCAALTVTTAMAQTPPPGGSTPPGGDIIAPPGGTPGGTPGDPGGTPGGTPGGGPGDPGGIDMTKPLSIAPASAWVSVDGVTQFSFVLTDLNADIEMVDINGVMTAVWHWSVSDTTIGTVNEMGVFHAKAEGSTQVIITSKAVADTADVKVTGSAPFYRDPQARENEVQIFPRAIAVLVGKPVQYEVASFDSAGKTAIATSVAWSITDESIATIDASGLATSKAVGVTSVIAVTAAGADTVTLTVVSERPRPDLNTIEIVRVTPDGREIPFGGMLQEEDSMEFNGASFPFDYLNGMKMNMPAGFVNNDVVINFNVPSFANVDSVRKRVEFEGNILSGITLEVTVGDSTFEHYQFEEPLELTIPYDKALLDSLNIEAEKLRLFYVGDDGEFSEEGITDVFVDEEAQIVYGKLSHFSSVVVAPEDVVTAVKVEALPAAFELLPNYPNPFNPSTTIAYRLEKDGLVRVEVFNILGQRVRTLVDRMELVGSHAVVWDGTDESGARVASGAYIYRVSAGHAVRSRTMLLMK